MLEKIIATVRLNRIYVYMLIIIVLLGLFFDASKYKDSENDLGPTTKMSELKNMQKDDSVIESNIAKLVASSPIVGLVVVFFLFMCMSSIVAGVIFFLILFFIMIFKNRRIFLIEKPLPNVRWGLGDLVRFCVIVVFFSRMLLLLEGMALSYFSPQIIKDGNLFSILNTCVIDLVALSSVFYFVVLKYGYRFRRVIQSLEFSIKKIAVGLFGYITALPFVFTILFFCFWILEKIGYDEPVPVVYEILSKEKRSGLIFIFSFMIALSGPIIEEIVFRGFVYRAVRDKLGIFWGIVLSAMFFSVLHQNLVAFVSIMTIGMLMAYLYEKTGSLLVPIVVHSLHNGAILGMWFVFEKLR